MNRNVYNHNGLRYIEVLQGCGLGSSITANSILSNDQDNIQSDRNFLELRGELVDTTTQ